jgi:hypothetical protein
MEDPPVTEAAASRNLAGSELEAGPTSRMFLRLFSGLSSGSEAARTSSSVSDCGASATAVDAAGRRLFTIVGILKREM